MTDFTITYNSILDGLIYWKIVNIQPMQNLIIQKWDTLEDKGSVIVNLSNRIWERTKSWLSFSQLFWTQSPHAMIERLARMNSRALQQKFNETIFRLLSWDPNAFYEERDFLEGHNISHLSDWDDGILLDRWEKHAKNPNPHHIIPSSRWGSNSPRNLWQADRETHDNFHRIFQNLTPSEQILVVLHRFKMVFSNKFKDNIQNILKIEFPEPSIYHKGVVDLRNFI